MDILDLKNAIEKNGKRKLVAVYFTPEAAKKLLKEMPNTDRILFRHKSGTIICCAVELVDEKED